MARNRLAAIHEALVRRRQTLLEMEAEHLSGEQELLTRRDPDPVDQSSNQSQAAFMAALSTMEHRELVEVARALDRLLGGSYGNCAHCGAKIHSKRLEVLPWTRDCVDCAEQTEAIDSSDPHAGPRN